MKAEKLLFHLEHDVAILICNLKVAVSDSQQFPCDGEMMVPWNAEIWTYYSS